MPFSFVEIGPNRFLPVSDEYTDDLYLQTLGMSSVPGVSNGYPLVAVFGIYSIDTCKTARTSFDIEILHCSGTGSGFISQSRRTLEFNPNVLQLYEDVAGDQSSADDINDNEPSLFAVEYLQRHNAWLAVGTTEPGHTNFRLALLGSYVQTIPV